MMKEIIKDRFPKTVSKIKKIKTEINTLFHRRKKTPSFPFYICLEITNACNLRCIHCLYQGGTTSHYRGKVGFVEVDFAKGILDQLQPYKAGVMLNGDGEALLHPRFHEIARHAVSLGLPNVYFNSNGTLFKREFVDEFITYYKGAVSISLDGFKESHERIRKGSSYDSVVNNIFYLNDWIKKNNLPIELSVSYCNLDQPEGEREEFIKYWLKQVNKVSIGEVYNKDYKIISNRLNTKTNSNRVECRVPWETFIVKWDGLVIPCSNCFSLDDDPDIVLGDAKKQFLKDIWNGKNIIKLRQRMENISNIAGTICENCERWNMYVCFEDEKDYGFIKKRSGVFTTYIKV